MQPGAASCAPGIFQTRFIFMDPSTDTSSTDTYTAQDLQDAVDNQQLADAAPVSSASSGSSLLSGLTGLIGLGATTYGQLTNAQTAAQIAQLNAKSAANTAAAKVQQTSTITAYLPMILAAAAGVLVLVLVFMRRGK